MIDAGGCVRTTTLFKFGSWNVQSINNKCNDVLGHIVDRELDIVFITETWLTAQFDHTTANVKDYGYVLEHKFRNGRGGGVGFLIKQCYKFSNVKSESFNTFEHHIVTLKCSYGQKVLLVVVYRLQDHSFSDFYSDFKALLMYICSMCDNLIIAGDINIHLNKLNDSNTKKFNKILVTFDLIQHIDISIPTHKLGNTIDRVITSHNLCNIFNILTEDLSLGDHFLISFKAEIHTDMQLMKEISFRRVKNINHPVFSVDLKNSLDLVTEECNSLSFKEAIIHYKNNTAAVLDKHAPLVTKAVRVVSSAPWFDSEYSLLRRERRKAERRWKKTGLDADREIFVNKRKETTLAAYNKKVNYYTVQMNKFGTNPRGLFNFANKFMDVKKSTSLPSHEDSDNGRQDLANEFNNNFMLKPKVIHEQLQQVTPRIAFNSYSNFNGEFLSEFAPTNVEELKEIVNGSPIKCSNMDSLPLNLTKEYIEMLLPVWCQLVNLSLKSGNIEGLKGAEILPLLKAHDLDPDKFTSYRPISNLNFVGKLVERVVLKRLDTHMELNNLAVQNQSGYKKKHSTETLLLKVTNDLLVVADKSSATVLLMLDLSAAFDTVDHKKLLDILF